MTAPDPVREARRQVKAGRIEEGLMGLRAALRDGRFDAEVLENAGRLLLGQTESWPANLGTPLNVKILGQCTTSWLPPLLAAVAWSEGVPLAVSDGGYDTVLQDLQALAASNEPVEAVVLLPWNTRLINSDAPIADRVESELAFWQQAWSLAARLGARILQVGFDAIIPGPLGVNLSSATGPIAALRAMNDAIRRALPAGAYFVDLDQIAGQVGRNTFYDFRRYYWTKQPFSEAGALQLSRHLFAGIRATTTGPKKVLVLDLDNTLWGGVVGETGPLGVALGDSPDGEAYRAFQKYVKGLASRGVVLAVASKNNPADAREPFEQNPDMLLKLDDFAAFEACWEPKGVTIARIAQTLELGLDSFVFFDDNPAEREQVRQALPEVTVADVPEDPADYVSALAGGLWFEAANLTKEDAERSAQYAVERKRRELKVEHGSLDDYLRSLEMIGSARGIDEADMMRVVQLLAKTNQFNLTTRRHTREDVVAMLAKPDAIGMTLRLRDRFGDYGLVGAVLAVPEPNAAEKTLRIDTWLMSCRVIGRTFEQFTAASILEAAAVRGYKRIAGEYLATKKNALVKDLYDRLGFVRVSEEPGRVLYAFSLDAPNRPQTFVTAGA